MKASARFFVLALLGLPLLTLFQNCSNVAFDKVAEEAIDGQSSIPTDDGNTPDDGGSNPIIANEKFTPSSTSMESSIDIIWVVDNSGSMSEEAANVRKNLAAFIQSIQSHTDLHFMLISRKGSTGKDTEIPSAYLNANTVQVNQFIDSYDGPLKLLTSVAAYSASNPSFFRANSLKSIVFVTDDESNKKSADFLPALAQIGSAFRTDLVTVNAFVGLGKPASPCQARTGAEYMTMAAATQGKTFNICEVDWTAHFESLVESTISKLDRTFQLADKAAKAVVSVEVDRVAIDASKYKFSKGVVTLDESVSLSSNSEVLITFSK
jgi:hypothetical protein